MDTTIITTIITSATTFIVSVGTWHLSARSSRKKDQEEMKALIESYRDELRGKMEALRDEVSQVNANVQQQVALIEMKIDTLSARVEKHNGVIDRTYKLEQDMKVNEERIKVANHRIDDLEKRV